MKPEVATVKAAPKGTKGQYSIYETTIEMDLQAIHEAKEVPL